ncbi:MAG: type II restriction endonuclease [Rhodobacteraceae bacterium]|nr:type II restriction endonuclease [Paracoccaceae bacterium]MBR29016.1 type II restriction endonuclease [Paracoccaceae bacterium]
MAVVDLLDWIDDHRRPDTTWYLKRLSANDTLATGAHQAGPYVPREVLFDLFPAINQQDEENPRTDFKFFIDSHADFRTVTAIWYNNRNRGGTRNEARLTNFGGKSSALLDPDSTGALTVFVFGKDNGEEVVSCHSWVCRTEVEEDIVEDYVGPVEPGKGRVWSANLLRYGMKPPVLSPCRLAPENIPPAWLTRFPTGAQVIAKAIELRPDNGLDPDERLLRRRACEFEVFLSIEEAIELPTIKNGFLDIDGFIARAQTILQRRKARSGKSLELHTKHILIEEGLAEGVDFEWGAESEPGRRPDFLFPCQSLYRDTAFPSARLRMLAIKTTCRDRWRQVLNEAKRIPRKHLLTLQEGVSVGQFSEMRESGINLVVPAGLVRSYPEEVRHELITLESFIGDIRLLRL